MEGCTLGARIARLLAPTVAAAALAVGFAAPAAGAETVKEHAFNLGIRAYEYGEPLLDFQRIEKTVTSVTVAGHLGEAPLNQFSYFTELATTNETTVVAPNADTLYTIGELELRKQPIVITIPAPADGRLNVAELISPYTENFANIGTGASGILAPGDYAIAGPDSLTTAEEVAAVEAADHVKVIHSPYDNVWIVARTLIRGPGDLATAREIQSHEHLVPLNRWAKEGESYVPHKPGREVTAPKKAVIPGTQEGESPLKYWKALGKALARWQPPAQDQPILEELAAVQIGPGKWPTRSNVSKETLEGLELAVKSGPSYVTLALRELFKEGFAQHNGWLVGNIGHYGTDYLLRAVVDKVGVGALTPNVSVYPTALTDRHGTLLNGATTRYVAYFPASDFPVPVQGFWSLTMYQTNGLLVPNALERFAIGDRSTLHFNPDGSLFVYIQAAEPTGEEQRENWLPAPAGGFQLTLRLYGTFEEDLPGILEGGAEHWTPPTVLPCLEDGMTEAGWECAS